MTTATERWTEIAAWFDELVELDPATREARLLQLDKNDPELAGEVRSLLAADDADSTLLASDAVAAIPGLIADRDTGPGDGIAGPYRLLRSIGEGGMGEVWLAERMDGSYEKQVAVKLLKRGMDTHAILRRFLQERRILALLHHPYIVRLVDGGMTSDGRPFYVMDYVDGKPITRYAAEHALAVRARVELLAEIADAVAYAHTQLVVHRDLKPSNILVDQEGKPRVLDFGIAKMIEESGEQTQTGTGLRVLSPAYAAPEQILGEAIGTTTDVYALGLLLCELLTGQLPQRRSHSTPAQLALDATMEIADRASTMATRLKPDQLHALYGDEFESRQLARTLTGDLDLIIATALQREPVRRYPTASALADDLRRWLERRPISARADSAGYRMRKFVRRHRVGVAASAIAVVSLILGLGVALWQTGVARAEAQRADSERANAERQLARSERVKDFLVTLFGEQDPISRASTQARTPKVMIRDGVAAVKAGLVADPPLQAQLLKDLGDIQASLDDTESAQATLKRAWELQTGLSGLESIASAEALASYGNAIAASGDAVKAAPLLRDALEKLRNAGAGESPRAGLVESSLAKFELVEGNVAKAETFARHAVEIFRSNYGADDTRVSTQLGGLGRVQQEAGNYPHALETYQEALRIVALKNGDDHVRSATLRTNIGDVLRLQRDYESASVQYLAALQIMRANLPADHMLLGDLLLRVGDLQRRSGKFDDAEKSFAESIAILGKSRTGKYAQALQTYGNLARARGDFELAATRFRKSSEAFRAATGDSIYRWISVLLEAGAMRDLEKFEQADALSAQAIAAIERLSPDDSYMKMYVASVMGSLRQAEGRYDEAIGYHRQTLEGLIKTYDKDHAEVAQARIALAGSLIARNEPASREEASRLLETGIEVLTRTGDTDTEAMLGVAYLERSRLGLQTGDQEAARKDVAQALPLLKNPQYKASLRQAQALARKLGVNQST